MKEPIRIKDVMTREELETFYELNELVLTSVTSNERRYYNEEIANLVDGVKERYFRQKEKQFQS